MGLKETLKLIDGQRSVSKEFRVRTAHGALLSVTTLILIAYLVYIEFKFNFKTEVLEKVHVNATTSAGLEIEFDVTLHEVPCAILAVDATDPTNQRQSLHLDQKHHVWKHRIDKIGRLVGPKIKVELGSSLLDEQILLESIQNTTQDESEITLQDIHLRESECGSCYGAGEESECCNTCDDVKRAYQRKGWSLKNEIDTIEQCKNQVTARDEEGEGCNVHAKIALSTGGGEVHLAPSRGLDHNSRSGSILDVFLQTFEAFNVSHTVQKMRFGPEFPGSVHQLDDAKRNLEDSYGMYQVSYSLSNNLYTLLKLIAQ